MNEEQKGIDVTEAAWPRPSAPPPVLPHVCSHSRLMLLYLKTNSICQQFVSEH